MEPVRYRYAPLKKQDGQSVIDQSQREIRIIRLLPSSHHEDVIRINIETESLDQCSAYEALSYVWGPQEPATKIWIDNRYIEVGPNLRSALVHLRYSDASRTLWIDRLAIDQTSVTEREDQVALMGRIYSSASKVVVWLGDGDSETDLALKSIKEISQQIARRSRESGRPYQEGDWDAAREFWRSFNPDSAEVQAVRNLLQRPWFGRVWTFQEIVLAKAAQLYCGKTSISANSMQLFLAGCRQFKQGPNIEDGVLGGADKNARLMSLARAALSNDLIDDVKMRDAWLGFMQLLHGMRSYCATDPRDQVYALLNLASDIKDSAFPIDYSKSTIDVYATTTKWLIQRHKNLAVLGLVETKDALPLVSWVPDFRTEDPMNFLRQPSVVHRGQENKVYQASGTTEAELKDEALSNLTVRGIRVGTIIQRTDPSGNINPPNIVFGSHVREGGSWQLFARDTAQSGLYSPTKEPIDTAFERIRVADLLPGTVIRRIQRQRPVQPLPKLVPERFSYVQVNGTGNFKGPQEDIGASIIKATFRRRMFRMDTGYLGLGHRSLEVGDEVYVLLGADTPFVLREINSNAFILRGDAYVHGIMDGEILDMATTADTSP